VRRESLRVALGWVALAIVLWGSLKVIKPFAPAILWALILGSATWPAYARLRRWFGNRETLAALAMTLLLTLVVLIPVVLLGISLVREMEPEVARLKTWATADTLELPAWVHRVPMLEEQLDDLLQRASDADVRRAWIRQATGPARKVLKWTRNLLALVAEFVLTLFTLFFVYRDGETLFRQVGLFLDRIAGGQGQHLVRAVRETVSAVIYGWLLTAALQGVVGMVGFWIVGLRAPVLLGVVTGLAAVVPFGVGFVWTPLCVLLALEGRWGAAIFLALWGTATVTLIDNVLRPLFISGSSRIPFIVVFFGVLGGLAVGGLLGLVLGPVFLAVLLALWREAQESFAREEAAGTPPSVA